jgi:hypothetical protein
MKQNFEEAADKAANEFTGYVRTNDHSVYKKGFLAGIEHATKWVDCKERLPELQQLVLIFTGTYVSMARLLRVDEYGPAFREWNTDYCIYSLATHWQTLPSPPSTTTV